MSSEPLEFFWEQGGKGIDGAGITADLFKLQFMVSPLTSVFNCSISSNQLLEASLVPTLFWSGFIH